MNDKFIIILFCSIIRLEKWINILFFQKYNLLFKLISILKIIEINLFNHVLLVFLKKCSEIVILFHKKFISFYKFQ